MAITLANICDAVAATLGAATGIAVTQSYDELARGLNNADLPLLQVYWEDLQMDPSGGTDRTTFQAGVRQKQITIHADLYARQLALIDEAMAAMVVQVDELLAVLEAQNTKPYFGLDGIKAFQVVSATRAVMTYGAGQSQINFIGARFVLSMRVY